MHREENTFIDAIGLSNDGIIGVRVTSKTTDLPEPYDDVYDNAVVVIDAETLLPIDTIQGLTEYNSDGQIYAWDMVFSDDDTYLAIRWGSGYLYPRLINMISKEVLWTRSAGHGRSWGLDFISDRLITSGGTDVIVYGLETGDTIYQATEGLGNIAPYQEEKLLFSSAPVCRLYSYDPTSVNEDQRIEYLYYEDNILLVQLQDISGPADVEVVTMTGKTACAIADIEVIGGQATVSGCKLVNGTYICRIEIGNKIYTQKFIVGD